MTTIPMPGRADLTGPADDGHLSNTGARMRRLHLEMIAAVMADGGLGRLAKLASDEVGAPVAIVVPRLGDALEPEEWMDIDEFADLRRYVQARVAKRPVELPKLIAGEAAITSGDEIVGAVLLLEPDVHDRLEDDATELLNVTAMATLTELAVAAVREETEDALRGSLIELIRGNPDLPEGEVLRRAYRVGSDLSAGAVALCAELKDDRPRSVMDVIRSAQPQALVEHLEQHVYALVPPGKGEDPAATALDTARRLADALAARASVGISSFCSKARLFHRAIQEAELVLDLLKHEAGTNSAAADSATYRLLFQALASHPEEVTRFYEDTVAPLLRYDDSYNTDLVGTVEAYLAHNCNMNATAAGIYAHRHTIAYRLERVRELTGLDPNLSEDRERLGLGLKAYRILAPRLHR